MVGTTTVDVVLTGTDRLPEAGEDEFAAGAIALLDDPARLVLGGNGANTAAVYARLGGRAELVSAIGEDELGTLASAWLARCGVGLEALRREPGGATACTVVATDRGRRRLALHHPGVSSSLAPADVPGALLGRTAAVLLASYHLLPRLRGTAAAEPVRRARAAGAATALDLGPCVDPVAGLSELAPVLAGTGLVLANAREVDRCTAGAGPAALLAAGVRAVVVKLGAGGARLLDADGELHAPALPVEAVSTVGAGDAFDAGYLYALARGDGPARALRFANATAALTLAGGDATAAPAAGAVDAAVS